MKAHAIFARLLNAVGIANYAGSFEGVAYFTSTVGELKNRAAIALPGVGIFVHPADVTNVVLLRHEYGHMLQAKLWGKFFFYKTVAWISVKSAFRANENTRLNHQHTWTEWSANRLSYEYFRRPVDWDFRKYPISSVENQQESMLPVGLTLDMSTLPSEGL